MTRRSGGALPTRPKPGFKNRVRDLTRRHRGVSLEKMIADLNPFVRGWAGYFGFSQWRELPPRDAPYPD
jgi:RNA-directed DNA polymerase